MQFRVLLARLRRFAFKKQLAGQMEDHSGDGVRRSSRTKVKRTLESETKEDGGEKRAPEKMEMPKKAAKKTGGQKKLNICDLPDDMLCEVFDRLPPNKAMAIRSVNKHWLRCIDKSLAKRVEVIRVNTCSTDIDDYGLEPMSDDKTIIVKIFFWSQPQKTLNRFVDFLNRFENVKCVDVFNYRYQPAELVKACPQIQQLFVKADQLLLVLPDNGLRHRLVQLTSLGLDFSTFNLEKKFKKKEFDRLVEVLGECKRLERVYFKSFSQNDYRNLPLLFAKLDKSVFVAVDAGESTINKQIAKRVDQLEAHFNFEESVKKFDRLSRLKLKLSESDKVDSDEEEDDGEEFENAIEVPQLERLELYYKHRTYGDDEEGDPDARMLTLVKNRFGEMNKLKQLTVRYFYENEGDGEFSALLSKMPNLTKLVVDNEITFLESLDCPMFGRGEMIPIKSLELVKKLRVFKLINTEVDSHLPKKVSDLLAVLKKFPDLRTTVFEFLIDQPDTHAKKLFAHLVEFAEKTPKVEVRMRFRVKIKERKYWNCDPNRCPKNVLQETEEMVQEKKLVARNIRVSCDIIEFDFEDEDDYY